MEINIPINGERDNDRAKKSGITTTGSLSGGTEQRGTLYWSHEGNEMSDLASARHEQTVQRFLDELEQAGKRKTPQRAAICRAVVESDGHPTVAEIYRRVTRAFPMISQATVYNTVDTLRELGLIIRLEIANHDHTHYDVDTEPHVNVVCRYCGAIIDVHDASVNALLKAVATRSGFSLSPEAGLILYGICPHCLSLDNHARGDGPSPVE